ncbi:MAG: hypothetical protein ACE5OZ_01615 [Candidatus Heimdallarchaeota archaeon]
MTRKNNLSALEDSIPSKAPDTTGLRLLVLVDEKTDPKPLNRFLHNLVRKVSIQAETSRLIFYKLASSTPYIVIPYSYGPGSSVIYVDRKRITPTEHEFLVKLATLVNDVIPGIKTETIIGSSLKEIAGYLAESQECLPDLIAMEKRSESVWRRFTRLVGLRKTDIQELSDELSIPVVRIPASYDKDVTPSLEF